MSDWLASLWMITAIFVFILGVGVILALNFGLDLLLGFWFPRRLDAQPFVRGIVCSALILFLWAAPFSLSTRLIAIGMSIFVYLYTVIVSLTNG